jgi:hypothetical protein
MSIDRFNCRGQSSGAHFNCHLSGQEVMEPHGRDAVSLIAG